MIRPDAIPVRALGSRAVLPPDAVATLFGPGAVLGPSARVEVVLRGEAVAHVAVETGPALVLRLDRMAEIDGSMSLRGPVGAVSVEAEAARSRLVMPARLRRAWGVGETAVLDLGGVAACVPVEDGPETVAEIERTLWLGAGRPETTRWLSGVDLAPAPAPETEPGGPLMLDRRVVTETDVRQARLGHRRIRLRPGQIVTPAARSLAREWDVFVEA